MVNASKFPSNALLQCKTKLAAPLAVLPALAVASMVNDSLARGLVHEPVDVDVVTLCTCGAAASNSEWPERVAKREAK